MKVVIDTCVIVAGVRNPEGPAGRVVDQALEGELIEAVYDDRMMDEYAEVLTRPRLALPRELVDDALRLMRACFERIETPKVTTAIAYRDPDDAPFIETAMAANVEYIVTRNPKDIAPYFRACAPGRLHVWRAEGGARGLVEKGSATRTWKIRIKKPRP